MRGGTLFQHLPDAPDGRASPTASAPRRRSPRHDGRRSSPAAALARALLGDERAATSTRSTTRRSTGSARGLVVSAAGARRHDRGDRGPVRDFLVGVQWHAEPLVDRPEEAALFERFVEACRDDGAAFRRRAAARSHDARRAGHACRPGPAGPAARARPLHARRRGGGDAARPAHAGRSRTGSTACCRACRRRRATASRPRRTARRSSSRPASHGRLGDAIDELRGAARRARRRRSRRSACGPPAPARTRSRSGRRPSSRAASATSSSTARCASWPAASRPSRCTCTSASPTPKTRSGSSTGCAPTCRCCSRSRPTRRSGRAATPASPRPARRCSRRSRASASRARSRDYADYVETVDLLIRCEARSRADLPLVGRAPAAALRHGRGADHGRADDARRHGRARRPRAVHRPRSRSRRATWRRRDRRQEVLDENRFLAARDGMAAELIDPELERRVPARDVARGLRRRLPPARPGARLRGRARTGSWRWPSARAPTASSSSRACWGTPCPASSRSSPTTSSAARVRRQLGGITNWVTIRWAAAGSPSRRARFVPRSRPCSGRRAEAAPCRRFVAEAAGGEDVQLQLDRREVVARRDVAEGLPGGDGVAERGPDAAVHEPPGMEVALVDDDPPGREPRR